MISIGTPQHKIKHDFKPLFKDIADLEDKKEMYDDAGWKTLQEWKQKINQNQIQLKEEKEEKKDGDSGSQS